MKSDDGCFVDSWRLRGDFRIGVVDIPFQHEDDIQDTAETAARSGKVNRSAPTQGGGGFFYKTIPSLPRKLGIVVCVTRLVNLNRFLKT